MKYTGFIFAALLGSSVLLTASRSAEGADPPYTDALCSRAIPNVTTFNDDAIAKRYAHILDDAQAVVNAYRDCTTDAQETTSLAVEPTVNYDKTRTAEFLVVLGRLQVANGMPAEAIESFKGARALAVDVAQWIPDAEKWSRSNSRRTGNSSTRNADRQPSRYKDAAVQIQASADGELAKLGVVLPPAAQPSASP
jgi:hypothetical protein